MSTRNITRVFRDAYVGPATDGINWYREAHSFAGELCPEDPSKAAGVIAALSPRVSWTYNKRLAASAFATGHATGHLSLCCRKADAIMNGADPEAVLGGRKITDFYRCILDPNNKHTVVVDRHAFDVYQGKVTPDDAKDVLKKKGVYDGIATAYVSAAKILTKETGELMLPSTVQAVTWVAWRNREGKGRGMHRDSEGKR